jgi:predicted NAD/FAD-binding protein
MPSLRRAWASWNYTRPRDASPDAPATLSYHMNRLQRLDVTREYFVTLNSPTPLPGERVIQEIDYDHPTFTEAAMSTQTGLPELNGIRRTYFCGSYHGYGFHEDGVRAAVQVARRFGLDL